MTLNIIKMGENMNIFKILLAEDEYELANALSALLVHEGYEVDIASDGDSASEKINMNVYDIIVLDVMMPKKDGLSVLRELRARGNITPVLMLTAKSEIENRVEGLDSGADDYLTKPFAIKELLARIRSLLRRQDEYSPDLLKFGNIVFDRQTLELSAKNSVRLANKEAELLEYMMVNAGKSLSTDKIFLHIWNNDEQYDSQIVWLYVSFLRKKLLSISADCRIIGKKGGEFQLILDE